MGVPDTTPTIQDWRFGNSLRGPDLSESPRSRPSTTPVEDRRYIDWYNRVRRHSACGMGAPIDYEAMIAERALDSPKQPDAARHRR
jgi:transposase InsO family protein